MKRTIMVIVSIFSLIFSLTSVALASGFLTLPTAEDFQVTCGFGCYSGHGGTDYAAQNNSDVVAAYDGYIIVRSDSDAPNDPDIALPNSYGNYITVDHGTINGKNYKTTYAHLSTGTFSVEIGDQVSAGQIIAKSGNSGTSTNPHLHFEVTEDDISVDPYDVNNYLWTTNPPSHGSTFIVTTFTSNLGDFNVNKGETLIVECTAENKSSDVMNIEKIAIAVHDKDGEVMSPSVEAIYNNGDLGWLLLQPGEPIFFPATAIDINALAVGEYQLIVKAYMDGGWKHLHEEPLSIRKMIHTDIQLKSIDPEAYVSTVDDLTTTLSLNTRTKLSTSSDGTWGANYGASLTAKFEVENTGGSDVEIQELALAVHEEDGSFKDNIGNTDATGWQLATNENVTFGTCTVDAASIGSGKCKLIAKAKIGGVWKHLQTRQMIVSGSSNIWIEAALADLEANAAISNLNDLVLTLNLDPGVEQGKNADLFLVASYQGQSYSLVFDNGSSQGKSQATWEWKKGLLSLLPESQKELFPLIELDGINFPLANTIFHSDWKSGDFHFLFGVDNHPDWQLNFSYLFFDFDLDDIVEVSDCPYFSDPLTTIPADGTTVSTLTPTLEWSLDPCVSLVQSTHVFFSEDINDLKSNCDNCTKYTVVGISFIVPIGDLEDGKSYYWKVGTSWGEWSEIFSFAVDVTDSPTISNWVKMDSGVTVQLNDIWGDAPDNVYAVGENGTILHYDGTGWSELTYPDDLVDNSSITSFISSIKDKNFGLNGVWGQNGSIYMVGDYGLIFSYDGSSWSLDMLPIETIQSGFIFKEYPFFNAVWGDSDNDEIFVVGTSGSIAHNNGSGWNLIEIDQGNPSFTSVYGTDKNNVYALAYWNDMQFYDGSNWSSIPQLQDQGFRGIFVGSTGEMMVVGYSYYTYYYDGNTWHQRGTAYPATLTAVHGSSENNFYAVGTDGVIVHFNTGSWEKLDSGITDNLHGIWVSPDGSEVFAVGENGTILHGATQP